MAKRIDRWTLSGLVDTFHQTHKDMGDRRFAFILGAGASVSSGIPSGGRMALRWLRELQKREDRFYDRGHSLEAWATGENLGIPGFSLEKTAEFYPQLFERTFRNDPKRGYLDLEQAMEGAFPGVGYSILAQILATTRHKVVISTNFDNLVAEALSTYAGTQPLVCGHESLAGFARVQLRRPLVLKIHRDLFLNPMNDPATVARLADGWVVALNELFRHYVPMVVGYGGNDGSLMGYLKGLEAEHLPGQLIWCYRQSDGEPGAKVMEVLEHLGGALVPIPGFDELMLGFGACLGMGPLDHRLLEDAETRVRRYRKQLAELEASMKAVQQEVDPDALGETSLTPAPSREEEGSAPAEQDLGARVDSILDDLMEKTAERPLPVAELTPSLEPVTRELVKAEPITKELPAALPARDPITKELPAASPGEFLPTTVMFETRDAEADLGEEPPLRTIPAAKPATTRRASSTLILPPSVSPLPGSRTGTAAGALPPPPASAPLPTGRKAQPATALLPGVGPTLSKIGPPPLDPPLPAGSLSARVGSAPPRAPVPPDMDSPTRAPTRHPEEPEEDTLILRLNAARKKAEKEKVIRGPSPMAGGEAVPTSSPVVSPAPVVSPPPPAPPTREEKRERVIPQTRKEAANQALGWFTQIFGEPPTEKVAPAGIPQVSDPKSRKEPS